MSPMSRGPVSRETWPARNMKHEQRAPLLQ